MNDGDIESLDLDRPNKIQIILSHYLSDEEVPDIGWECDVLYENNYIGGSTAPTIEQAFDAAKDVIDYHENPRLW